MSRELLKRALSAIMSVRGFPSSIAIDTMQAIEAELNKPEPEPVAWLSDRGTIWHDKQDAVDDSDGFVEPLYTTPLNQSARIAQLEKSESFLKDAVDRAIQDTEYYQEQLAALQAKREPLSDDEIRDCAESENIPYFENKEEFDAFTRAIEAAHGIGTNHE